MKLQYVAVVAGLLASGCSTSAVQVAASAETAYDGAVAVEVTYLESAKVTAAEATTLRALRVQAYAALQAYVTAAQAGASNVSALEAAAMTAINNLLAEADTAQGTL